jgi:hypothetical protein
VLIRPGFDSDEVGVYCFTEYAPFETLQPEVVSAFSLSYECLAYHQTGAAQYSRIGHCRLHLDDDGVRKQQRLTWHG